MRFLVVMRGRNCDRYIDAALQSLCKQTHTDWKVLILLDNPTDTSARVAQKYMVRSNVHVLVHSQRQGLGFNMWFGTKFAASIFRAQDSDVVAYFDADDKLHPKALAEHARVYDKHPEALLTYGSYIKMSKGKTTRISRPMPKKGDVRKLPWHMSHLKTARWSLVKHIDQAWFMDGDRFIDAASDLALMFPLAELAGLDRCRHVHKPIYYWRDNTPSKTSRQLQRDTEKLLRSRKPLKRVTL